MPPFMRHDNFTNNIIEGKKGRGRPRHSNKAQIKERVAIATYKEVKETALGRENWIKLH